MINKNDLIGLGTFGEESAMWKHLERQTMKESLYDHAVRISYRDKPIVEIKLYTNNVFNMVKLETVLYSTNYKAIDDVLVRTAIDEFIHGYGKLNHKANEIYINSKEKEETALNKVITAVSIEAAELKLHVNGIRVDMFNPLTGFLYAEAVQPKRRSTIAFDTIEEAPEEEPTNVRSVTDIENIAHHLECIAQILRRNIK